jgi:hypothetical protein
MKSFALFLMGFATMLAVLGADQRDTDHMVQVPEADTFPFKVGLGFARRVAFQIMIPEAELVMMPDSTITIHGDTMKLVRYMVTELITR